MRAGKTVVSDLLEKYHNGEMADPADYDPRNPDDVTWSNTQRFWGKFRWAVDLITNSCFAGTNQGTISDCISSDISNHVSAKRW